MGYVRCLRYVLPIMVKQGGGRVVNLIGNDGVKPSYMGDLPGSGQCCRSESDVVAGRAIRQRTASASSRSIRAGADRAVAGLVKAMSRDMKISTRSRQTRPCIDPNGRIAEVDEVANLVTMLASPLMEMVNGTMIEIDGGQDKPLMDRFRDKPKG